LGWRPACACECMCPCNCMCAHKYYNPWHTVQLTQQRQRLFQLCDQVKVSEQETSRKYYCSKHISVFKHFLMIFEQILLIQGMIKYMAIVLNPSSVKTYQLFVNASSLLECASACNIRIETDKRYFFSVSRI